MPNEVTLGSLGKLAALAGGPLGLAQKYSPDIYSMLNEGLRPLFEEAGKLQHYGNEYYDAGPATQAAIGTIGAPAAAGGVPLGALGSGIGKGIRAYHSSPHDFERFDLSKIGTGEGHQAYGRGLYFAENPAVSGQGGEYWHQFKEHFLGPESEAADYLARAQFNREHALQRVQEDQARIRASKAQTYSPDLPEGNWWHPSNADKLQAVADLLKTDKPVGPRTYEVNINAKPEQLLDWNKPLQAQPEGIQRLAQENPRLGGNDFVRGELVSPRGESIYRRLQSMKGEAAPKVLDAYGVPGLKYLDQGSRGPTFDPALEKRFPQTSNYVMWRDDLVDILKKYGIGAAVPAAGAMMQPSDERQ